MDAVISICCDQLTSAVSKVFCCWTFQTFYIIKVEFS